MNEDQVQESENTTQAEEVEKFRLLTISSDDNVTRLRTKSKEVSLVFTDNSGKQFPDNETMELIEALKSYVVEHNGLGMAGIQLGVDKRVFVMRKPFNSDQLVVVINPKMLRGRGKSKKPEGCFSIPMPDGVQAMVQRPSEIWVSFTDEHGNVYEEEMLVGMQARIFQHELDHLDGYFCIDEKLPRGSRFLGWTRS